MTRQPSLSRSSEESTGISSAFIEEELLAPSLSEDDDLRGFHQPWNPNHLSFAAFFIGPFGSAWLYFENFRRLGQRRESTLWALRFVLIGGGTMVGAYWYNKHGGAQDPRLMKSLARAVTVVLALMASHRQRARWRLFHMSDQPPGRLWLALLVALGITFGAALAMVPLLKQLQ